MNETVLILTLCLVYIVIFGIGLLSKNFRSDYVDWLTIRDPFGFAFWRNNLWFLWFNLFISLLVSVILISGW